MERLSFSVTTKETGMSYLNKLFLFVLFALIPLCASGAEYRIEADGNDYAVNQIWSNEVSTGTFPNDFLRDCLAGKKVGDGQPIVCRHEEVLTKHFDLWVPSVRETVRKVAYTVTVSDGNLKIETTETPVARIDVCATIFMVWLVVIGIAIVSVINGWTMTRQRHLFAFYGAILGVIAFGGWAGDLSHMWNGAVGGLVAGWLVGALTGGFAGGLASMFAGSFASLIAGAGAGLYAGQHGWIEAGISEYLVFIVIGCSIAYVLRLLASVMRRARKLEAEEANEA